ncbi:carbonic anhydrase 13-like [Ambystoma mexicanum]|uniref:carbonic anhydrase 13-like n=1 Tax=Ambystoma mexicanum TaxID=8296 RepID=UPI0037E986FE
MATKKVDWGYAKHNGPRVWHEHFPHALGKQQSPIDIITREVVFDDGLKPLSPSYDPSSCKKITNNGHSFMVEYDDRAHRSVLGGGPFIQSYRLRQFHFHWGHGDHYGSEHTVDGYHYASELHMVHWNSEKYATVLEAAHHHDGFAVLGVFLKVGEHNHALQKIIDVLGDIQYKGDRIDFKNFDPASLMPENLDYWTYRGSLTVPPLIEVVTWIILRHPIPISPEQLAKFRSLHHVKKCDENTEDCHMLATARPTQPLGHRQVKAYFA